MSGVEFKRTGHPTSLQGGPRHKRVEEISPFISQLPNLTFRLRVTFLLYSDRVIIITNFCVIVLLFLVSCYNVISSSIVIISPCYDVIISHYVL